MSVGGVGGTVHARCTPYAPPNYSLKFERLAVPQIEKDLIVLSDVRV
jgi:hypothetical protein